MRLTTPLAALLLINTPLPAQSPRDTVTGVIVGRRESAEVRITFDRVVPRPTMAWSPSEVPIHPGLGAPIILESTLPLRLDTTLILAGRFQLLMVGGSEGPTLVIQTAREGDPQHTEVARVAIALTEMPQSNGGLSVELRTARTGEDVIQVVDRSTPRMTRISKEIYPGTTRTLAIQVGKYLMRVPIAAR